MLAYSGRKSGFPMPIIDRYIITVFVKIFVICFLSFAGLYVVIDAFTNLEELSGMTREGSPVGVISGYYGPRVLQFFDKTAAFLALVAAIFCLALMQRSNELTAIQASGVPNRRIARPVLAITIAVLVLSVVNRELVIPKFRNELALNAQDMLGAGRQATLTADPETGVIIRGQQVIPARQEISLPEFRTPDDWEVPDHTIAARSGAWLPANDERPSGYLLNEPIGSTAQLDRNIGNGQSTRVYVPAETPWLAAGQLFVVSSIDTVQLAFPAQLARNASIVEMISRTRQPEAGYSNRLRVDIHGRVVQPVFDLTVLLIGLPLIIARGERNLYLSAGVCLSVVMVMSLVLIASQALGALRIISPPALAAWLPLILFVPVSWVTYGWLGR